ncbi:unnamed protein product [Rhizophagus irregularis]|nr:unnamed protein product [Rhizophagus irregularis]
MVKLMIHSQFYLQQKIFEQHIIYWEEALNNGNIKIINNNYNFKKESKYISELKLMYKSNFWNSMIAFFGLALVLHRPIESLFPNTNNKFMNQIYNRIILPRQNTKDLPKCIIMWNSCSAKQFQMTY